MECGRNYPNSVDLVSSQKYIKSGLGRNHYKHGGPFDASHFDPQTNHSQCSSRLPIKTNHCEVSLNKVFNCLVEQWEHALGQQVDYSTTIYQDPVNHEPFYLSDASSLRVLGDRRPFEKRLKQRRGRKAQASHVIRHPSMYNVGNQEKMAAPT
ncbi:hypothetical protein PIB30_102571, partial [Stylosanthes scabra]|nr:hypothetical protein [Stylosanthes scabra]